jgi:DNA-binding winged helix-turn-helix (wHTH) protein
MGANSRPFQGAETFRFGEFLFDCGSRQLLHHGVERHLSPKAQQLLHLLLLARPRVLSREELYDALWPSTFVSETNLASIVNEVRRTLGDGAREPQYIRTVHGFGYAFCGQVAPSMPVGFATLTLMCEQKSHPLYPGENTVGRAPDARVIVTDRTVSRYHALITIDDGELSVEDLGSKNGTFVDGERIGRAPVIVTHDTQIVFGAVPVSINPRKLTSTQALQLNPDELRRRIAPRTAGTRSDPPTPP